MSGWNEFYEETPAAPPRPSSRRRKSKLPEAAKLARSLRSGKTVGELALRYGINSYAIIQALNAAGWNPKTGLWDGGDRPHETPLTMRAGGAGQTCHHVGGGENPNVVPTVAQPYREPRPRPTGLVWPERPPMPAPAYKPRPRARYTEPTVGRSKLTEAQQVEICQRYRDSESSVALGHEYGITDRTVRKVLRRRGVQIRTRGEALRLRYAQQAQAQVQPADEVV